MSRFTKRKYVEAEVLNTFNLPTDNQQIVKVNLFYVFAFKCLFLKSAIIIIFVLRIQIHLLNI